MDTDEVFSVLNLLRKSEHLGETVLRDRSEIVQMDRIRQKNREALSALKRRDSDSGDNGVYLCVGNMFIKYKSDTATKLIEKDQKQVNEHIEKLRRQIKNNVINIKEIENKGSEVNIFNLNPLSTEEMRSFNVIVNSIKKLEV